MTVESSPTSETTAEVVADTTTQVTGNTTDTTATPAETTAASAPADGEPKSLLDAIRKAVPDKASPAPESTESKSETKPEEAKATEGAAKEDESKPPPFHEHPRWKQVIGERDGLKRQVSDLTPDATGFRQVRGFMTENGLNPEEVKQGFAIMAALKNNPAHAWELLQPTLRDLGTFLGHTLPPDLKAKVDEGQVDEATARETARLRHATQFAQTRTVQVQQTHENEQQVQAMQRVAGAVDSFVGQKAANDPDFKRIEPLLAPMIRQKQAEWGAAGKPFNTIASAVALTQDAYAAVTKHLSGLRPARQEIRAAPTAGGNGSTAAARPASLLDAIKQAVSGTYQG